MDGKALVRHHAEGKMVSDRVLDSPLQGRCQGFDSPRLHTLVSTGASVRGNPEGLIASERPDSTHDESAMSAGMSVWSVG